MSLTVSALNAAKPATKPYKLFDGKGLYLSVQPTGTKIWRLKYRFDGKEKKLALGAYPEIGLKDARAKRDSTKSLLAVGTDPGEQKRLEKLERAYRSANTFRAVAEEYIGKRERDGLAGVTISKSRWLLRLLSPAIGTRPIAEISAQELLSAIRRVEAKGNYETARRMRSFAGRTFRYAIATG
ncbi:MAG: tyrosine-type recombinase/integrase, partial [Alphaproteobacteria bacterium]